MSREVRGWAGLPEDGIAPGPKGVAVPEVDASAPLASRDFRPRGLAFRAAILSQPGWAKPISSRTRSHKWGRSNRARPQNATCHRIRGGDDGIRTHDLRNASAALSQLSYVPNTVCFPYYSRLSDAMVHTELRICALRIGTLRSPECRSESLPSGRCVSLHSATATYQDSRPTRGSVSTSGWRFWSVTLARSCFRITFFLRFGTATIVP